MIKLKSLLKEDLLGELNGYEVYKNPKSITRMEDDIRGISFPDGDLFVVNDARHILHHELSGWLIRNGYRVPVNINFNQGILDGVKTGYVTWQRRSSSNEFWLGESISFKNKKYFNKKELIPYLEKWVKKVKSKNSQYKFVLETIR